MRQIEFATRAQWGKRLSSSPEGKHETWELDFGRGHRVLNFVIYP